MVLYSDLRNWINGNRSDISREGLISLVIYYEGGQNPDDIEYDLGIDE